jgi:acyl-CoA hydrolase
MEVQFRRIGQRRYALRILRENLPPLECGAPGYDPLMPHDLQHLIVESELGLTHGVFGFMAAGGQAGGPADLAPGEDRRTAARRRAKAKRRDEKMLRNGGRDDGSASERAAYICWYEWLRRSRDPERRRRAASMTETVQTMRDGMPENERQAFTEAFFTQVCARMDELSAKWSSLKVGDSFSVEWTCHADRRRHPSVERTECGW